MLHSHQDGFQEAYRKVKTNVNSEESVSDNDEEVDILGDMASDDDSPQPRQRRPPAPSNNRNTGSRNQNAPGVGAETVENNTMNVGIRPNIGSKQDDKALIDPKMRKSLD